MTEFLPAGSILGSLELDTVYEYFDGPVLFTAVDEQGGRYLAVAVGGDEMGSTEYLYVPVSDLRLRSLRAGTISLRDAFAAPQSEIVYRVLTDPSGGEPRVEPLPLGAIRDEWLPDEGEFLHGSRPTPEAIPAPTKSLPSLPTHIAAFEPAHPGRVPGAWTEQETRSRLITPALVASGWNLQSQVREDFALTAGRVVARGNMHTRERSKRADYVLYLKPDIPLAVVEAKDAQAQPGAGMQQALGYAAMLDVPFAFSTNGSEFLFHDATIADGVVERTISAAEFPSPDDLWRRFLLWKGLGESEARVLEQPFHQEDARKPLRYYQAVAANRAVEAVAQGSRRVLLVMATGTGKTLTAFQIMWRLRASGRAKRILFLVDRNVLADQALVNDFRAFGSIMTKVTGRTADKSYEVYLALYQAVTGVSEAQNIYKQFSPDFFDLVVVDECHRGSAAEDSSWRVVLEYFSSAIQIGLTATPRETEEVSNMEYFGPPVYTYSLREGISDGFLAPFKVRRIDLDKDLGGWRPTVGQIDRYGNEIPDRLYTGRDYDRSVVLDRRTPVVAESITKFLKASDRYGKTIVFCEDIEHAERMRQELVNANADLIGEHPNYVVRITGDSPSGAADLDAFMDPESPFPVIATTSKLLTTGVDVPTCKVIAIDQTINSLTEFKQIIGRGTRLREDHGKMSFTILDFRSATRLFADPDFDGEPEQIKDIDDPSDADEGLDDPADEADTADESADPGSRAKYYVDGVPVTVVQERVQYFDNQGRLITESLRDYTRSRVLDQFASLDDFLRRWTASDKKAAVMEELAEHGVLLEALEHEVGKDFDPFDLICHVVFDAPVRTRRQRADRVRESGYFSEYGSTARAVLDALLTKYASEGPAGIEDAQVLRMKPISDLGTPVEIIRSFGGRPAYEAAIRALEARIYETP